jgi:hypothetical protein
MHQGTNARLKKNYANLILNFLIAMVKKKIIIPKRTNVSFQMACSPNPFIITDFTIM